MNINRIYVKGSSRLIKFVWNFHDYYWAFEGVHQPTLKCLLNILQLGGGQNCDCCFQTSFWPVSNSSGSCIICIRMAGTAPVFARHQRWILRKKCDTSWYPIAPRASPANIGNKKSKQGQCKKNKQILIEQMARLLEIDQWKLESDYRQNCPPSQKEKIIVCYVQSGLLKNF